MAGFFYGVDLGGTFTKIGLCHESGELVDSLSLGTGRDFGGIVGGIGQGILSLKQRNNTPWSEIFGIGIGCPAPVLDPSGTIDPPNLPIKNLDLVSGVLRHIGQDKPLRLINDADAAALAEHRLGAGKDHKNIVLLSIGTGIGGGIIIDGRLYTGSGGAGEIGHMRIGKGTRRCGCGGKGCFETYASISALIRLANSSRKKNKQSKLNNYATLDGKTIFDCYFEGDKAAIEATDEFLKNLAVGIKNIDSILSPELIILGGAVSKLGDELISPLKHHCKDIAPKLKCAHLSGEAGMIGAALFIKDSI